MLTKLICIRKIHEDYLGMYTVLHILVRKDQYNNILPTMHLVNDLATFCVPPPQGGSREKSIYKIDILFLHDMNLGRHTACHAGTRVPLRNGFSDRVAQK